MSNKVWLLSITKFYLTKATAQIFLFSLVWTKTTKIHHCTNKFNKNKKKSRLEKIEQVFKFMLIQPEQIWFFQIKDHILQPKHARKTRSKIIERNTD